VLEKIKQYCKNSLSQENIDYIIRCGARDSGTFNCADINKLYNEFHEEIWEYISDEAGGTGNQDVFDYLSKRSRKDWNIFWGDLAFKQFLIEIAVRDACQIIVEEKELELG
jgi:hypothetical protein